MKIGITGGYGFIGWHLRCYLKTRSDIDEVRIACRQTFELADALQAFITDLDLVIHLAGANRGDDTVVTQGNTLPAQQLVAALEATEARPCVIVVSSTHADDPVTIYGRAKAEVAATFDAWAQRNNSRLLTLVLPHVFGEYCRPFYNSAVGTFCHQIARGETPTINGNGQLELIHVQDLAEQMISLYMKQACGLLRIKGTPISVREVAGKLINLHDTYINHCEFPDLSNSFDRSLFNALRGGIPDTQRKMMPVKHSDSRGWLVETVKVHSGGQCFVSTTKPGITRGNHFHRRKVERFFVLQGRARIKLRKLFSDNIISFDLDGNAPSYVDMPTLYTHSITNIGETELITLFWADEFFDANAPDTYYEEVIQCARK